MYTVNLKMFKKSGVKIRNKNRNITTCKIRLLAMLNEMSGILVVQHIACR